MYLGGFSTQWWEEIFLVGIFHKILLKTPQKTRFYSESFTMSVWNPITLACDPQNFKSFERAVFQNIAWASTQRRKCGFLRLKTRIFHFKMEPHSVFQSNPSTQEQYTRKIMMTERIKNLEHRIKICERFSHWARTKRSPNRGDWTAKHANRRR